MKNVRKCDKKGEEEKSKSKTRGETMRETIKMRREEGEKLIVALDIKVARGVFERHVLLAPHYPLSMSASQKRK